MGKNAWEKNKRREITGSMGRYMAILAIVALGVGFFSGLKVTKSAMLTTGNEYIDESEMYDFRLLSTLGIEDADVDYFSALDGVTVAEGAYSVDFFAAFSGMDPSDESDGSSKESSASDVEDSSSQGADDNGKPLDSKTHYPLKALSIGEQVNRPQVMEGRLPGADDECVLDYRFASSEMIGGTLAVAGENDEDTRDLLVFGEYKIVGIVSSSSYLNMERGTTSLEGGTLSGYVYIPMGGFDSEVFTEAYIRTSTPGEIYSTQYKDGIEALTPEIEDALTLQADLRYDDILTQANDKLQDAQTELNDNQAEYLEKKADAEKALADSEQKLLDGEKEIAENEPELLDSEAQIYEALSNKDQVQSGLAAIESGKAQMKAAKAEIASGWQQYHAGKAQADTAFAEQKQQLDNADAQLRQGEQELQTQEESISAGIAQLQSGIAQLDAAIAQLEPGISDPAVAEQVEQLKVQKAGLETQLQQAQAGLEAINTGKAELAAQRAEYEAGLALFNSEKTKTDAQLAESRQTLVSGEAEIAANEKTLLANEATLYSALEQLQQAEAGLSQIADAKQELTDAKKEIADGWEKLDEGKAEADKEFADAEKKLADGQQEIDDAREELADIKEPKTYALGRDANTGYVCFESDSNIVDGIAAIFPVFFFLVAALVCMTTMTRMVEEQRTQIGTLKGLGYSNMAILWKYVSYSGSAALIGSVVGFFGGTWLFPMVIWNAYGMLYGFAPLQYVFSLPLLLISVFAALLCCVGATFAVCRSELSESPATLMRPKAPKAGKRVFLERIGFIWNRLSFMVKVSIRNIVRYKKRFIMMVIGISGCTALMLAGFGIRDSIGNIASEQFDEIMIYDLEVMFSESKNESKRTAFIEDTSNLLTDCVFVSNDTAEISCPDKIRTVNIVATGDENITKLVDLHSGTEKIPYPGEGEVVMTKKLAEYADIKAGDTVTVKYDDETEGTYTVSGLCDNYVMNYLYMTDKTYTDSTGEEAVYKSAFALTGDGDVHAVSSELINEFDVTSVSVTDDMKQRIGSMMESLDAIVFVVVACAGALAFIVLFNLSNINITEREREIATIKVLGFYPKEVSSYVFRENMVLTAVGALTGLPLGIWLHSFIMDQIKIDMVSFKVNIEPISFILAVATTFVFAVLVNLLLRRKLDRIHMAESLKSVE